MHKEVRDASLKLIPALATDAGLFPWEKTSEGVIVLVLGALYKRTAQYRFEQAVAEEKPIEDAMAALQQLGIPGQLSEIRNALSAMPGLASELLQARDELREFMSGVQLTARAQPNFLRSLALDAPWSPTPSATALQLRQPHISWDDLDAEELELRRLQKWRSLSDYLFTKLRQSPSVPNLGELYHAWALARLQLARSEEGAHEPILPETEETLFSAWRERPEDEALGRALATIARANASLAALLERASSIASATPGHQDPKGRPRHIHHLLALAQWRRAAEQPRAAARLLHTALNWCEDGPRAVGGTTQGSAIPVVVSGSADKAVVLRHVAAVFIEDGHWAKAREYLRAALELSPNRHDQILLHLSLAQIAVKCGQPDDARSHSMTASWLSLDRDGSGST